MTRNSRIGLFGTAALGFSVVYFASDLIEAVQGGFSTPQLLMTFVAEAAIPFVVIGLCLVQRPPFGLLGQIGALAYAYCYVFFTLTVTYAIVAGTPDFDSLSREFGPLMTLARSVIVLAGLAFAAEVIRAGSLPRWTGFSLGIGVVLVAATQGAPDALQLLAVGLRDAGFAGMGLCLIGGVRSEAQERPGDALSPEVDQPEVEQREVARADGHPGRGAGRALTSGADGA